MLQRTVDDTAQFIVETRVENKANDQGLLVPLVDAVVQTHEAVPEVVLADRGYCNESDLTALENRGIDAYVAQRSRQGSQCGHVPGYGSYASEIAYTSGAYPIWQAQMVV